MIVPQVSRCATFRFFCHEVAPHRSHDGMAELMSHRRDIARLAGEIQEHIWGHAWEDAIIHSLTRSVPSYLNPKTSGVLARTSR